MSKGLKAFEEIKRFVKVNDNDDILDGCPDNLAIEHTTQLEIIEKELQALEIIKETLAIFLFETTEDNKLGETHYFIDVAHCCSYQISKEKYELLKEIDTDE